MDKDKEQWMEDMLGYLAEDIRETKKLTAEVAKLAQEAKRSADAATEQAKASWELVVITRNDIQRPWYKKLLGIAN